MSIWQGKQVVITGGSGFLGSKLVRTLAEHGALVTSVSRCSLITEGHATPMAGTISQFNTNLLDDSEFAEMCERTRRPVSVLIHCAALDGNSAFKVSHPAEIISSNLRIATNVLEAARLNGITDVVLVSSAEIYSPEAENPVNESDDYTTRFTNPSDGYVLSKIMIEMLGQMYAKQFGLRIYIPRLTNLYGPGDGSSAQRGRVIPSMLSKILSDKTVTVWGDGQQTRTFIHVEDAAKAILLMVEKGRLGPLNIATTGAITIEALATHLFAFTNTPVRIEYDTSKPVGHRARLLNVSSLYEFIDFEPRPFIHGLRETVEWYTSKLS